MHPYETELLARAHIDDLRREAEQDRRAVALLERHGRGGRNGAARRHPRRRPHRAATPAHSTR